MTVKHRSRVATGPTQPDLRQVHLVHAELEVSGLRNPCRQIEPYSPGLLAKLVRQRADGEIERLAEVTTVVRKGGMVIAGDPIEAALPPPPYHRLKRV